MSFCYLVFFFQAEDGIRDYKVTGVQTCALPISKTGVHFDAPACQLVRHQRGSTGLLEPQLGVRVQVVPDFLQLAVVFADALDGAAHAPIRIRACLLSQAFSSPGSAVTGAKGFPGRTRGTHTASGSRK